MEKVLDIIKRVEQEKNVTVLYACETGSRAWGFPSPDSDYDVRFLYMHKRDWYLSLGMRKDSIEFMDGDFDTTGWDLRKSLLLLKKSNAPLIERFQSPVTYYARPGFREDFYSLIQQYYSPVAVFYHHYSLAGKFWAELKDKEVYKLKSFFYLVRSLLSCCWIVKDPSLLPMHIEGLMIHTAPEWRLQLREMIALKATVSEQYLHKKDQQLFGWISSMFAFAEAGREKLTAKAAKMNMLDDFFLKMVNGTADNRTD